MQSDNAQGLFSSSLLIPNRLFFTKSCTDGKLCVKRGDINLCSFSNKSLASNSMSYASLYNIVAIIRTTQFNLLKPKTYIMYHQL